MAFDAHTVDTIKLLPVVNETRDEQKFIILEYVFLIVRETSPYQPIPRNRRLPLKPYIEIKRWIYTKDRKDRN